MSLAVFQFGHDTTVNERHHSVVRAQLLKQHKEKGDTIRCNALSCTSSTRRRRAPPIGERPTAQAVHGEGGRHRSVSVKLVKQHNEKDGATGR